MRVRSRSSFPRRSPHTVPERFSGSFPVPYRSLLLVFPENFPHQRPEKTLHHAGELLDPDEAQAAHRPALLPAYDRELVSPLDPCPVADLLRQDELPPVVHGHQRLDLARPDTGRRTAGTVFFFFLHLRLPFCPILGLTYYSKISAYTDNSKDPECPCQSFFSIPRRGETVQACLRPEPGCRAGRSSSQWRGRACA